MSKKCKLDFKDYETNFVVPSSSQYHGKWEVKEGKLYVYLDPAEESPDEVVHTTLHEISEADINKLLAKAGYPCHEKESGEKTANYSFTYRTKKYGSYGNLEITTCLCHFLASASLFEFPKRKDWRKLVDFYLYVGFFAGAEYSKGQI